MSANPGMGLVIGMGLGTVFIGLICIIVICYIMGAVIKAVESKKPVKAEPEKQPEPAPESAEIADRGELIAVISAAIAEELGESAEAFRITSLRKVN